MQLPRNVMLCFVRCALSLLFAANLNACGAETPPDVMQVPPDLRIPAILEGEPAPGKLVMQSLPSYAGGGVHHALYLPEDWKPGLQYPVIIEYHGNNRRVKDIGGMGYGISGGKGFIWAVLPYVSADHKSDAVQWWGDVAATVAYAKEAVPLICAKWGGDPKAVILAGHSRGAIACNYIGLHDDEIAKLWRGMVACSHYDNGINAWGMTPKEKALCTERLRRLGSTPQFICGEYHSIDRHEEKKLLTMIKDGKFTTIGDAGKKFNLTPMQDHEKIKIFVTTQYPAGQYMFLNLPFVNHTPEWVLRDITERKILREWVRNLLAVK